MKSNVKTWKPSRDVVIVGIEWVFIALAVFCGLVVINWLVVVLNIPSYVAFCISVFIIALMVVTVLDSYRNKHMYEYNENYSDDDDMTIVEATREEVK